ncbi:hypothetical protein [Candidiatus Paracoxiella cheracis]|uniref:hypothetical protein n=1 Tax=Candidiatus Paracoxiella cheracis TaxID=3405120 RepID=UPI003BF55EA7
MFFYIPQYHALCTAEDATHTLHNVYSLRGAKIRDALAWSKYLNETIYLWGNQACRDARDRLLPSLSIIDSQYATT